MGKFDCCMKEYLQNKEYFADLFNGCCFDGQTVIRAEDLTEASETYTVERTEIKEAGVDQMQIPVLDGTQEKTIEVESTSPYRRVGNYTVRFGQQYIQVCKAGSVRRVRRQG